MAGGLGSRFWPISRTDNPKQFVDVVGVGRSMLQLTFERFERLCPREHIVIVTGEAYVDHVREQLPDLLPYQVLAEPLRRNTAPCVAYAASVIGQMDPEAVIIVTPSDHAVFHREKFVADMQQALATVQEHDWIITLGVQPTRPDSSYGYIQIRRPAKPAVGSGQCVVDSTGEQVLHTTQYTPPTNLFKVVTFTEKPPVDMARQMIASGEFFWNAGIFVWTLPVLRKAYQTYLPAIADSFFTLGPDTPHDELERIYSLCESVSIDNGIMENASNVHVLTASFAWSDVETWESLYDVSRHDRNGNALFGADVFTYNTRNCLVVMPADQDKTVILEGLDGYIVAANEDTLMVCRRKNEEMVFRFASDVELKKLIDKK
ncbi:MAG: mannose-1-phosphate guanylyltransferase [Bacteroidales bacterium]|nr:mannose-1-phosphate guanylyltransferase [Bacteroidales bacterium]